MPHCPGQCYSDCGCKSNHDGLKCRRYFFGNRSPFSVGVSKPFEGNKHLLLLSGNFLGKTELDNNGLPDFVAVGERPCRYYGMITSNQFTSLWLPNQCGRCRKPCFKKCPPNAFVNFTNVSGQHLSAGIKILDAHLENGDLEGEQTLVMVFRYLHSEDKPYHLDKFDSRIFNVSMNIDAARVRKLFESVSGNRDGATIIYNPVETDNVTTLGPTVTTTQAAEQALQQAAQQQGTFGAKHHKKHKKHKKKHHKKKHHKKKDSGDGSGDCGDGGDGSDNGSGNDGSDSSGSRNAQKKKQQIHRTC